MERINEVICRTVYNFLKDKIDEIIIHECSMYCREKEMWNSFGYTSSKRFLSKVKNNVNDAVFAFTEIMGNCLFKDYVKDYVCNENKGCGEIYMMLDKDNNERYFYFEYSTDSKHLEPIEMKKVKKLIEVETFEKL
jgi:hypothetical protein